MELLTNPSEYASRMYHLKKAEYNERFVGECLKLIMQAVSAEDGLRQLLQYLGRELKCDRVYVFEEMDRQNIRNTYEWCRPGVPSGMEELPYVTKKDLFPWYGHLINGGNIIEPDVESLKENERYIYDILKAQNIHSIILSPLRAQGKMYGLLGADNPPAENLKHISIVFDVLAYFVYSLVSQRELTRFQESAIAIKASEANIHLHEDKTVLLIDDSTQLLRLNERILRQQGYRILCAETLQRAQAVLMDTMPDAVISDIDLPDGSGLEFCRKLHERRAIPIVFLTAHCDEWTVREGMQAGGCAVLTKPYQLVDLQEAVAAAINDNSS